jgi:hypothetical protein
MARVVSIHEYELKPGIDAGAFARAIRAAEARGLLDLPGLVSHHFVKGIKGVRMAKYAAIWIYESRDVWQRIWGTPERPRPFHEYPTNWQIWEGEVLAPFLTRIPDKISFTTYEELEGG